MPRLRSIINSLVRESFLAVLCRRWFKSSKNCWLKDTWGVLLKFWYWWRFRILADGICFHSIFWWTIQIGLAIYIRQYLECLIVYERCKISILIFLRREMLGMFYGHLKLLSFKLLKVHDLFLHFSFLAQPFEDYHVKLWYFFFTFAYPVFHCHQRLYD